MFDKKSNVIYLTFDDGPTPGVTNEILAILKKYHAKATFFCLGKNIISNPELFNELKNNGHTVANHSFSHFNGWKTKTSDYLNDVEKASVFFDNNLFRPPYGRVTPYQYFLLRKKYKVVFWNKLSKDYDLTYNSQKCFNRVKKAGNNDIIVFHDSIKAQPRVIGCLENTLNYFSNMDFQFKAL